MYEEGNGELAKMIRNNQCPRCKRRWQDIGVEVHTTMKRIIFKCFSCNLSMEERWDNEHPEQ
jgi:predicted  nucleic acid-binding Zn ribbon protein